MSKTSTTKKIATSKRFAKCGSSQPQLSGHTALRGVIHSTQATITEGVTDDRDKLHRLCQRRKSQRNIAWKKVIKQWQRFEHTESFLGTLQTWNSGLNGYFGLDDFIDHVGDAVQDDERDFDGAVDRLAVAHKRLHDAIDALNASLCAHTPSAPTKHTNGNYDSHQVRDMIRDVAANSNLGREAARNVLDQVGDGVETVLDLRPENFDKVYEACRALLGGEGAKAHVQQRVADDTEDQDDPSAPWARSAMTITMRGNK
jgi:hypothetical protein